jgi:hypothetical protein
LKGCLDGKDAASRSSSFRLALGLTTPTHTQQQREQAEERWTRLHHLVLHPTDRVLNSAEAVKWQSLTSFVGKDGMGAWDTAHKVFNNETLVQRVQLFGSCFELAPVVVAHYALWFNNTPATGVAATAPDAVAVPGEPVPNTAADSGAPDDDATVVVPGA